MQTKRTLTSILPSALVILSITTFIICLFMNFIEFQHGGATIIKSVIVTFSYATVWILTLIIGILIKKRGIVKYCIVFWIITLITSVTIIYANTVNTPGYVSQTIFDLIFPLILLFVGQWYGLRFFIWSTVTRASIVSVLSLVMVSIAIVWLKRNKST